ncbi:MAG: YeeE/YedE family protein [Proteobacteria bacterium]|nr:YeeE/YedE family protein [Pseudomonadota bacterium]
MHINWEVFTPWSSLLGGCLIGFASALLVLTNGKIAGISGILAGVFSARSQERGWRALFLVGLIGAPVIYSLYADLPHSVIETSSIGLVIAGLLVGIGTRIGGGCTSGHGVIGLSRLSLRSLVATITFMFGGFVTVYIVKHLFVRTLS